MQIQWCYKDLVQQKHVCRGSLNLCCVLAVIKKRHYLSEINIGSFVYSYKEKIKSEWPAELHAQRPITKLIHVVLQSEKMMSHRLVDVYLYLDDFALLILFNSTVTMH